MAAWGRQQNAFAAETARFFLDLDLTMAQFRVLALVGSSTRTTGRDLAARLDVTAGALVPLCDRLVERGYLQRSPGVEDRRVTWLELTSDGEDLVHRVRSSGGARMRAAIETLAPADRRALARLLDRIAAHLEAQQNASNRATES
jgi:MarR family transcriptional regulator, organic hydroperoxide resistance regulator